MKTIQLTHVFIISAFLLFLLASCQKEGVVKEEGVVHWTGEVAVDGCDWTIQVNDNIYHPDKLSDDFKKDGLTVKLKYKVKSKEHNFSCGLLPEGKTTIEVLKIEKK